MGISPSSSFLFCFKRQMKGTAYRVEVYRTYYKGEKFTMSRWTCGNCGTTHARDHNAAMNLEILAR